MDPLTRLSRRKLLLSLPLLGTRLAAAESRKELTFFVAGDSHFGVPRMSELNRVMVDQLNSLPGTPYPAAAGGVVAEPRGVLFMGDMTDTSLPTELREFEQMYGLTGRDGLLRYPVFEAIGNHDYIGDSPVIPFVKRRHGDLVYSWDWEDVHFVCLDMHPDRKNLEWFARDVRKAGRRRPLVVFFHYCIAGPFSDGWPAEYKDALAEALRGLNVLGLFHGHFHMAGNYVWQGHDVFLPGSPRHRSHAFVVVRLTAHHMTVAYRNFDTQEWTEVVTKNISR
jgi:cytolysin (calcineurin-like family phosphatase)